MLYLSLSSFSSTEGIPCPDVPSVANTKQRYEESRDGVYISFICNYAHMFPDRSSVKRIECNLATGEWSESPPDCEGRLKNYCISGCWLNKKT